MADNRIGGRHPNNVSLVMLIENILAPVSRSFEPY
jgi:hypothetical protein